MASKQVTDREKSTRFVVAAVDTHAEALKAAFEARYAAELQAGEVMPDTALVAKLVARALARATASMVDADQRHAAEQSDDAAPRAMRDDEATSVSQCLVDLRAVIAASCGQDGLVAMGLDHPTPADPSVLLNEGTATVARLRDPAFKLPPPKRKGLRVDVSELADELEKHLPPLRQALGDVAREVREAEQTLQAKRTAIAANDAAFSLAATWLSATLSLTGFDDLASRVRPAPRRPGQADGAPEPDPEG